MYTEFVSQIINRLLEPVNTNTEYSTSCRGENNKQYNDFQTLGRNETQNTSSSGPVYDTEVSKKRHESQELREREREREPIINGFITACLSDDNGDNCYKVTEC